jgi:hypothetical protein
MTDAELWDALDGLYAFDSGATDSGLHDTDLRRRAATAYAALSDAARARFIYEHMSGWDPDDIVEMIPWLNDLRWSAW